MAIRAFTHEDLAGALVHGAGDTGTFLLEPPGKVSKTLLGLLGIIKLPSLAKRLATT